MCNPMAIQMIAQGAQATLNGYLGWRQLESQREAAVANERRAKWLASDAIGRGERDAATLRLQAGALEGQQRAAAGASGFAADSGSFVDIIAGSREFSELDIQTARANAQREAYGFETEAEDWRRQAQQAQGAKKWAWLGAGFDAFAQSGQTVISNQTRPRIKSR